MVKSQKANIETQNGFEQYRQREEYRQVVDIRNLIGELFALLSSKYPQLIISESIYFPQSFSGANPQKTDSSKKSQKLPTEEPKKQPSIAEGEAPYSMDFMNIVKLVNEGKTPPNVREIDDSPLETAANPIEPTNNNKVTTKPWQM